MEYYIERNGQVEGPHSLSELKDLHSKGLLVAETNIALAGDADWRPFSEVLRSVEPASAAPPPLPAASATPPPLASGAGYLPSLDQPLMMDGKVISGTEGKTRRQIVEEVKQGGRFVVFQYAFSIVVMSFRRSGGIKYIPPGKSGAWSALGWSLISFHFGWWGIPWGIFYTIGTIWTNTGGGVDVTEPILATIVGPADADAITKNRPPAKTGPLLALRLAFFGLPIAWISLLGVVGAASSAKLEAKMNATPGYKAYKRADDQVDDTIASSGGNTVPAAEAARGLSAMMGEFIKVASTTSDRSKNKDTTVWCENRPSHCLFMVRVPDLRKYRTDAKDTIALAAWNLAQNTCASLLMKPGTKIAVAIRGDLFYDRVMEGTFSASEEVSDFEKLPASVRVTKESNLDEQLTPYFVD